MLHRQYGTTYYFATQRMPRPIRQNVHALYGFVRKADEWVDDKARFSTEDARDNLAEFRSELIKAVEGHIIPNDPVLRAFSQTLINCGVPLSEALLFLEAMESDLTKSRYASYKELEQYMRGSAAAVGLMMCSILGVIITPEVSASAVALGNAMQLTNFLRDVGEDWERGRLYIPQEDFERFQVDPTEISVGIVSDRFVNLMQFEISRARSLYEKADRGITLLPTQARRSVLLARILYSKILDKIEANDYDVLNARARTSRTEKLLAATRVAIGYTR
ncbi:MAG TPA: phytoene/squalene synthase family protein [Fimbriimonadaceae bacterium]|nr:phytoene/squalene synthase family protein [Fimbriimonadaceae bacterium]